MVFFNKLSGQSQEQLNDATNRGMFQVFEHVAGKIDPYSTQTNLKKVLLTKRQRANSTEEYLEALGRNVAFFLDYQKQMESLLVSMIDRKAFVSPSTLATDVENFRNHTQSRVHSLKVPILQQYNVKFPTVSQRMDNMEFDYCFYALKNDLMISGLDCIVSSSNFTNCFFKSPSSYVKERFNQYIDLKVSVTLESISFK